MRNGIKQPNSFLDAFINLFGRMLDVFSPDEIVFIVSSSDDMPKEPEFLNGVINAVEEPVTIFIYCPFIIMRNHIKKVLNI